MADTTTEKEVQVAEGLGNATPSQVLAGTTFSSEEGFNLEGEFEPKASNITYDNTSSGLSAQNTQAAIDEINANLTKHENNQENPHKVTKKQIGLENVENKTSEQIRDEITENNVIKALKFTPIQQGGGNGQSTNKIYIGWSGTELKAQVDTTDMGALAFKSHLNDYLPKTGGTMSGNIGLNCPDGILGNKGGQFTPDGNVKVNTGGYSDWLTNILNSKINVEPEIYNVPTVLDGVSFTYYKFGKIVLVCFFATFKPVKTPYDGGSITIMDLADMPNVPRPARYYRMYAHAIANSAFHDCIVAFNFDEHGQIAYLCSADNIYAEYHGWGMFVTN